MKKFFAILIVALLASSLAFSQVNDNSGSVKQGTGSFKCTVLTPLTIDSPTQVPLGEFVVSATPYSVTNGVTFTVGGEALHVYYFKTVATNLNPTIASFAGGWDMDGDGTTTKTLDAAGASTHTYTLTGLTALASGSATLSLQVDVAYNSF